jgi:organic hydroperoxide reductase OsmC/OhrA
MLTFLHVARLAGFHVDRYDDEAVGDMAKNERGIPWIATVTLNPKVTYAGDKRPSAAEEAELHHKAHDGCFISQSVKTEVKVAGVD